MLVWSMFNTQWKKTPLVLFDIKIYYSINLSISRFILCVCVSVRLSVCVFTFESKSDVIKFWDLESSGESNEKKWSQIWRLLLIKGVKSLRRFFFHIFSSFLIKFKRLFAPTIQSQMHYAEVSLWIVTFKFGIHLLDNSTALSLTLSPLIVNSLILRNTFWSYKILVSFSTIFNCDCLPRQASNKKMYFLVLVTKFDH